MEPLRRYLKPHQIVSFILYPATIFVAFLYSALGNPPNTYFSSKRNIFNVLFVKIGWFWVTLVYFVYLCLVRSRQFQNMQAFKSGTLRYFAVTLYWYAMTQWLFGPSFIDRIYILTGGKCISLNEHSNLTATEEVLTTVVQQQVCRKLGGQWIGGHDVSGHCVLLIHASLFFWEELSWLFYNQIPLKKMKRENRVQFWSVISVLAIAVLWWVMLFMTGVYFHGHFELLSGAFFGVLGWAILVKYKYTDIYCRFEY
ncbi:Fat storage-inducing transmembrane protein [Cokeromyces recurvatus]|uniref:Fat storage-inducing transmembrane protein n=1 Tax=Cokeromyces recurvatus TaxID=90255 RepID=UPI00221E7E23|nr:Fat storage-inducing transmembrane protein [Cokeromyces recurvatus]KAI7903922.1 Fat storage-inducing transmembrane protein [Cokeromyces recurvatus]